ncbi:MAG: FtsX-like permease family protein [Acidobacteriota bacterium]
MKYLHLILANLRRKKIRTALTVGSFAVALFLFGMLVAIHAAFYQGVAVAGADRLVVINKTSLIQPLPISYRERLAALNGVKSVTFASWFGGVYQDERNFFVQFAVDTETYRDMFNEFVIPDDQWRSFVADREGAVVGAGTAARYGFKVGDRIPIKGTIFPGTWEFNIRAIYTGKRADDDVSQFWFHYKYLEERGPRWFGGLVGWYTVRLANPDDAPQVVKAIDERFANSPFETKTETERAFAAAFVKQMGNIELLIITIGTVVLFTLLLVTGNTMAIAVRERVAEIAVFKTVGFTDLGLLALVLAESAMIAVAGGVIGVLAARGVTPGLNRAFSGMSFYLSGANLALGVGLALVVGLAAGALPALSAMRLRVVDALRRV